MKNYGWLIVLFLLSNWASQLSAQDTLTVDPFDEVIVTGNIELELVPAAVEGIVVEQGISKLRFDVFKGVLRIKRKKLYRIKEYEDRPIYVRLAYNKLRVLKASAGAQIINEQAIVSTFLRLRFSSGSRGKLELDVDQLSMNVSEGARLKLRGKVREQTITVSTGAILDAHRMDSNIASVRATTGGEAEIHVLEAIDANANTGGDIDFTGNPQKVRIKDTLGGDVHPRGKHVSDRKGWSGRK